jgi:hypothetical protein
MNKRREMHSPSSLDLERQRDCIAPKKGGSSSCDMIDEETLAQMNGKYVMPPDAGPAWRAACADGIDMALIEENLRRTPWERMLANDRALALLHAIDTAKPAKNGSTH